MSEELWLSDLERICEDYACGRLERDDALGKLVNMGLDRDEADEWLRAAKDAD